MGKMMFFSFRPKENFIGKNDVLWSFRPKTVLWVKKDVYSSFRPKSYFMGPK